MVQSTLNYFILVVSIRTVIEVIVLNIVLYIARMISLLLTFSPGNIEILLFLFYLYNNVILCVFLIVFKVYSVRFYLYTFGFHYNVIVKKLLLILYKRLFFTTQNILLWQFLLKESTPLSDQCSFLRTADVKKSYFLLKNMR